MRVEFCPMRSDEPLSYVIDGEVLVARYLGEERTYDFTGLPDGRMGASDPLVKQAARTDGVLEVRLVSHLGIDASEEQRFPVVRDITEGTFHFPKEA